MSDMSDLNCTACGAPLERVRYFPRQLLTADDLIAEQDYQREKLRRHQRNLHGWGVVCGCSVQGAGTGGGWQVKVSPGVAVSPYGDEINIGEAVAVDLLLGMPNPPCTVKSPCPPMGQPVAASDGSLTAYVAVRHAECWSRPVSVHPAGCGCDSSDCEYSRIRESFEIKVLWSLPQSHVDAMEEDKQWRRALRDALDKKNEGHALPVPACLPCATDPWVVLATVRTPSKKDGDGGKLEVSYKDRRVLWSTRHLQVGWLDFAG
jgi:hypothetical protein